MNSVKGKRRSVMRAYSKEINLESRAVASKTDWVLNNLESIPSLHTPPRSQGFLSVQMGISVHSSEDGQGK